MNRWLEALFGRRRPVPVAAAEEPAPAPRPAAAQPERAATASSEQRGRVGINPFTGQPTVFPERLPKRDASRPQRLPRATTPSASSTAGGGESVLIRHDDRSPLPCLCARCLKPDQTTAEVDGMVFHRQRAERSGRVVYYWLPATLLKDEKQIRHDVETNLNERLRARRA